MPGPHRFKTGLAGVFEKGSELDLAVAHDIGIGGDARSITPDHVVDHSFPVSFDQIDDAKGNAQLIGHRARVIDVPLPRTLSKWIRFAEPDLHVAAFHLVPLLLQQVCGHAAVHSTRHGNQDFFHRFGYRRKGTKAQRHKGTKAQRKDHGLHGWARIFNKTIHCDQEGTLAKIFNNVPFSHLIRLRRNRIASRTRIFFIIILLERSSILLPTCHAVIHEGGRHQAKRCLVKNPCTSVKSVVSSSPPIPNWRPRAPLSSLFPLERSDFPSVPLCLCASVPLCLCASVPWRHPSAFLIGRGCPGGNRALCRGVGFR